MRSCKLCSAASCVTPSSWSSPLAHTTYHIVCLRHSAHAFSSSTSLLESLRQVFPLACRSWRGRSTTWPTRAQSNDTHISATYPTLAKNSLPQPSRTQIPCGPMLNSAYKYLMLPCFLPEQVADGPPPREPAAAGPVQQRAPGRHGHRWLERREYSSSSTAAFRSRVSSSSPSPSRCV